MTDDQIRQRLHTVAHALLQRGLSDEVLTLVPLLDQAQDSTLRGEMARLLAFYWVRQNRLAESLPYSQLAVTHLPRDVDAAFNLTFALCQLGRLDEAIAVGEAALTRLGEPDILLGLMTNLMAVAGHGADAVRRYGTRTLAAKDRLGSGAAVRDLRACAVPAFDATKPGRNIISFSLFGQDPRYLDAAVWNAQAARFIYPGWTCRFYIDDSVPQPVRNALQQQGAQLALPQGLPAQPWGTLWRFLVADDENVDRYLLRDADSLINTREAAAVQEWIASGHHFHLMRDHFDHSDVMLAGMWGGVRGALAGVGAAAQDFLRSTRRVQNRTADQEFLCERLWPTVRQSVLAHDSQFSFGEVRDFPACATLPPGCWVGGDARQLLAYAGGRSGQPG